MTFPGPDTTYLPRDLSEESLRRLGHGDYEPLLAELAAMPPHAYERVGVDRAVAIAVDLALLGTAPDASILDIGCSIGTIAVVLAHLGFQVTGIDSDIVAEVQDWQDPAGLETARRAMSSERCRLLRADAREFLQAAEDTYDVALLLSVLHHWLEGYGYRGVDRFDRTAVDDTLRLLCRRVRSHLYVEVPIGDEAAEMRPDPEGEFLFPGWFQEQGLASSIELVASTIATNGKPRRLYRVDLL